MYVDRAISQRSKAQRLNFPNKVFETNVLSIHFPILSFLSRLFIIS